MTPVVVSGAAVVTAAAVSGVAATSAGSLAAPDVELAALVIEGSSTNPTGDGIRQFYGGKFDRDDVATVNFFTGPFGVYDALKANAGEENVVLSSGWGAANVSLLLSYLAATNSTDADLTEPLYILDNNVARPNGGFGTRYPVFAVIGVNPIPTPEAPGVKVIDVGYEYDINGNTPAYVLNPVAMANSLATYFDNRLNQNDVALPVDTDGNLDYEDTSCAAACQADIAAGKEVEYQTADHRTVRVKQVEGTTYISYRTEGLPLLQPVRQFGGDAGDRFADAVEPALKAAVDYGYPDNDALANPDRYEPARLVPTVKETRDFAGNFADGVREGLQTLDDEPTTATARGAKKVAATEAPEKKRVRGPVRSAVKDTIDRLSKPLRGKPEKDESAAEKPRDKTDETPSKKDAAESSDD